VLFVANLPAHVCLNEIIITPTYNRDQAPAAQAVSQLA